MRFVLILTLLAATAAVSQGDWAWILNVGPPINTSAWEYWCSIDNDKIFFNRDDGKIYVSEKNESTWSNPQALPPPINDPGAEAPYWHWPSNYLHFCGVFSGGYGSGDIWKSHWTGSTWEARENLGPSVNTSANEYSCCISTDGNYLYFSRDGQIYIADKSGNTWINARPTGIGQGYVGSYLNGYLYFHSNRSGGYGNNDVWKVQGSGTSWGPPQNLGSQINTSSNEGSPTWTSDGKYMYFHSNKPGGYGSYDLYWARYTETAVSPASLGQIKAMFQ